MSDEPLVPDSVSSGADLGAMPDLGGLLDSFQKVQEARAQIYEGVAGGGVVRVRATGDMTFEAVEISKEVVDPDDVEMLNDLVLAALHDLAARMLEAQQDAMGALGGLDISGLLGGGTEPG